MKRRVPDELDEVSNNGDGDLENGIGHLSITQIPVATANAGYGQSSLSWTPETPTTTYDITGEMEFVAVFAPTP